MSQLRKIQKAIFMDRLFFAVILVMALVSLAACDVLHKVDNMNNNTSAMKANTDEMKANEQQLLTVSQALSKTTDDMSTSTKILPGKIDETLTETKAMNSTLAEVSDSGRQGQGLLDRKNLLEAIKSTVKFPQKAVQAGLYFDAFEYQFWTGVNQDTGIAKRDLLMHDAAREFMNSAKGFIGGTPQDPVSVWDAAISGDEGRMFSENSSENMEASFAALAFSMDEINRKQTENLATNKLSDVPESMYDIIVLALQAEKDPALLRHNPAWATEVQQERPTAIRLLQARYNALMMGFLGQVVPQHLFSLGGLNTIAHVLTGHGMTWTYDLKSVDDKQLQAFTTYLKKALSTRQALVSLGEVPQEDSTNRSLLRDMNVATVAKNGTHAATQAEFLSVVQDLRRIQAH